MILPEFQRDTYSIEDVETLCLIGDLAPNDFNEFRVSLENCAAVYRWETAKWQNKTTNSQIARELRTVAKRSSRLVEAMESLSDTASMELDKGIWESIHKDFVQAVQGQLKETQPSMFIDISEREEDFQAISLEQGDLCRIIKSLEAAIEVRLQKLPRGTPGQGRDWGLRIWMVNIKDVWEKATDTPFSRDESSRGVPITKAARFCEAAFKFINPDCPTSRIMREMKDLIARRNKSTGRIVPRIEH